jgi:hypothetical protein
VLTIQVQQLRRRLGVASDDGPEAIEQALESIEGELHGLSAILTAIRDEA